MESQPCERPPESLSDDMVPEILLLLPTHSVVRLAAVCKQWLRAADPVFLAARARRTPPLQLLRVSGPPSGRQDDAELSVVVPSPPSAGAETRRLLARYTASFPGYSHCTFLASCDGLLLFKKHPQNLYLLCNPTTRRWSLLPRMTPQPCSSSVATGFYLHRPSGEYRVLCRGHDSSHGLSYYVLSAGGAEPRRLDAAIGQFMPYGRCSHLYHVVVGDKLYWIDLIDVNCRFVYPFDSAPRRIMAFYTVSETFRLVAPPPEPVKNSDDVLIFELDGALTLLKLDKTAPSPAWTLQLWVLLEDYDGGERWSCSHQVQVVPALSWELDGWFSTIRSGPAVGVAAWDGGGCPAGRGRGGSTGGAVACSQRGVTLYGVDTTAAAAARALHVFACGGGRFEGSVLQVVFKKNTVAHAFFNTHPSPGVRTFGFL